MHTSCCAPWVSINSYSLAFIKRQRGTDVVGCVAAIFLQPAYTYWIACPTLPALMCHALYYTVLTEAKVARPTRPETTQWSISRENRFRSSFDQLEKYPSKKTSRTVCVYWFLKILFRWKRPNASWPITYEI